MIKKIPLPITGVMLGLAALGNLLQSYSEGVRLFCGVLSGILGLLFLCKVICYPKLVWRDLQNPMIASTTPTFSMALMLLSFYLQPFFGGGMVYLWMFAILLQIVIMVWFTITFVIKRFDLKQVYPGYFVMYVGIVVASVTAPAYGQEELGTNIFWFGFVMLLFCLLLITYRYRKHREIPEPAMPLFCIYTAPCNLCLAGYLQSVQNPSIIIIIFLATLGFAIYCLVVSRLPKLLRLPFYPSYAAFTFPFVISAIALKQTTAYLVQQYSSIWAWLNWLVLIQTIIAVLIVFYALFRYLRFLFRKEVS